MTLKNSLSDKQTAGGVTLCQLTAKIIKRHIWLPLLALIGFILNMPVMTALVWNAYAGQGDYFKHNRVDELVQVFQVGSSLIIIVGAALAAFTLFRYLQVRQQVDFYHSLPIRREKYFAANMLAGLLVFLAPYLLAHLANLLMMAMAGILPVLVMADYVQFVLFNILAYLLMFALTTLAMMLAGSMPAALKILVGVYGLAPAVGLLRDLLGELFYANYLYGTDVLNNLLTRASVLVRYCWISWTYYDWQEGAQIFWQDWLVGGVLLGLSVAASLWLYQKRSSECAGSTLAFGWQRPIFKYPYVLLFGCLGGIMFYAIGNENIFWLYFGVVIATTFFAQLLEIFIKSDFRAIRKGWAQVGICIVLVSTILGYYAFDIGGFDDWKAEAGQVAAVNVSSGVVPIYDYYRYYGYSQHEEAYWQFGIDDFVRNERMLTFDDPENVAALVSILNSQPQEYGWREYEDGDGYYNWISSQWVDVVYTLTNGKQVARMLNCADVFENADAYRVLLGSDELHQQLFMYNDELDTYGVALRELNNLDTNDQSYYEPEKMTEAEGKEFLQVYTEEFTALSGDELLTGVPVASINLHFYESMEETEYGYDYINSWYTDVSVYAGMPRTISLIEKYYGADVLASNMDLYRIVSVVEYLPQLTEISYMDEAERNAAVKAELEHTVIDHTVSSDVYRPYIAETGFVEGVTMRNGIEYKSGRMLTPANNAAEIAEIMANSINFGRINRVRYYDMWRDTCPVTYYEVTYKDDTDGGLIYEERYILPDEAEYQQMMEQIRRQDSAYKNQNY